MKPLVFLQPLSERLTQLKESIEETAEAENIEIFDIESIDEFNELAPHIGQFLVMCSTPKLCARLLQVNSKIIRKEQSKVILLSAKQYPRKTIDRLNKLGLTDFILENVAAKTLQYKVKLQLRSIVVKKEVEEVVLFKHEEKEKDSETKVEEAESKKEEDSKNPADGLDRSKMSENEIIEMQKKMLDKENEAPKEYPGKASLVIEDDINPDTMIGPASEEKAEEEKPAVKERRSKSQADTWSGSIKKKTIADLEKTAEERKKNLPWHKDKEGIKGKSTTDKIDNRWSSQSNKGPSLKEKGAKEHKGEGSSDKLEKDQKGEIGEQEGTIETHWEGEVIDYTKEEKEYGEEESLYGERIDKHYEGKQKSTDKLNQDFETAENEFKEKDKESMQGVAGVEKKKARLEGDTVKELIQQDDLQTGSDGTDEYENDMESKGENTKAKEASLLKADFQNRNKINDEMNSSLEEDRNHQSKETMDLNSDLHSGEENGLSAEPKTDKSDTGPMGADSKMDKLGSNLTTDSNSEKKKSDLLQSNGNKASQQQEPKEKENSLLKKIQENRKKKNAPKAIDGHMRSPKAKKRPEALDRKEKDEFEKLEALDPMVPGSDDPFEPSDFSADNFENDDGTAETENKTKDDMSGDSNGEDGLEDMAGDATLNKLDHDLMEGESKQDENQDGYYDNFGNQIVLNVEDDEEAKKKKRLAELYELKKEKLAQLAEKERKRKEALAGEEDLYKKERDWDEKTLSMDDEDKKKNDVEMADAASYGKTGQENLNPSATERSDNYSEDIIEARQKHKKEEIQIDEATLSDEERELLKSIKDWGEQTIDYSKIKAGQDGFTTTREASETETQFNVRVNEIEAEAKVYKGTILDGDLEEEQIQDEEGEDIIHPDSKGIESIVKILNSYFTKDIKPSEILDQTCELVNKERGFGVASFFYRAHNTDNYTEILNGHEKFSSPEHLTWWNNFKQEKISDWVNSKLPTWSDRTFKNSEQFFIYPYFEGVDHLGFAVVTFAHGMKEENASRIEITLESARAVYLSQRHKENGEEAIYNELKDAPKDEVLTFVKEEKKEEAPIKVEEPRKYMQAGDNLIMLEKVKVQKEKEEKEKATKKSEGNVVKKLWNRMFG